MPIYEYACKECSHTMTALQKMSDEPLIDCPECAKPALKRLISAPRFRLKGAGWYETDFKKDNQRNVLKSDSEPDKSSGDGKKEAAGDKDKSAGDKNQSTGDKVQDKKKPKVQPAAKAADSGTGA